MPITPGNCQLPFFNGERNSLSYFLSILIVLAPLFSNYVLFEAISIGDFFIFIAAALLTKHFKVDIVSVGSIVIAFIIIFIGLFVLIDQGVNPGFFRLAFYYSLFFFLVPLHKINFEKFFSVYIHSCIFFSASLIFQWVVYTFLNTSISFQLPIPYYEPDTLEVIGTIFRSGGWFREPSYFAIFIMPAIFYLLNHRYYSNYFFVVIAGIISTSSLAVFVFLLSALIFFIETKRGKKGWLWLIFLTPVFVAMAFGTLHFFSEWTFVSKTVDIILDGGTLNERLLPVLDIILLTVNITPNPIAYNLIVTAGDSGYVWYSSMAYIIASFGWLGFLFISLNFFRLGIFAGIMVFVLALTSHIFSGAYSFFVILAFCGFNILKLRSSKPERGLKFNSNLT